MLKQFFPLLLFIKYLFEKLFFKAVTMNRFYFFITILNLFIFTFSQKILIVTLSYNRADFIEIQNKTFKKFLKDDYEFVVFNDAPDLSENEKSITNICKKLNIRHIRIPQSLHEKTVSCRPLNDLKSPSNVRHANAINYFLQNLGFDHNGIVVLIDSDIFLVRPFSIVKYMEDFDLATSYLVANFNGINISYLSPHLIFFNMEKLPDKKNINFNCGNFNGFSVDVGGYTYYYLQNHPNLKISTIDNHMYSYNLFCPDFYGPKNRPDMNLPKEVQISKLSSYGFNENEIKFLQKKPDTIQYMLKCHFFHFRCGTNYDNFSKNFIENKIKLVNEYLEDILNS